MEGGCAVGLLFLVSVFSDSCWYEWSTWLLDRGGSKIFWKKGSGFLSSSVSIPGGKSSNKVPDYESSLWKDDMSGGSDNSELFASI